jgi:hypothetical protein
MIAAFYNMSISLNFGDSAYKIIHFWVDSRDAGEEQMNIEYRISNNE